MARYILQTWQRVKEKEGVDRQDWYKAAMASLKWVRSQQNPDGGLPAVRGHQDRGEVLFRGLRPGAGGIADHRQDYR